MRYNATCMFCIMCFMHVLIALILGGGWVIINFQWGVIPNAGGWLPYLVGGEDLEGECFFSGGFHSVCPLCPWANIWRTNDVTRNKSVNIIVIHNNNFYILKAMFQAKVMSKNIHLQIIFFRKRMYPFIKKNWVFTSYSINMQWIWHPLIYLLSSMHLVLWKIKTAEQLKLCPPNLSIAFSMYVPF